MSHVLLTKLYQPAPPAQHIPRPHLMRLLDDGLRAGRILTLVSAPAGFGKTACISAWLAVQQRPVAWLSLDEADDDPGRFFTYLVAALQRVDPAIGEDIAAILQSGQLPPADIISTTLLNDMLMVEQPFILALDDFHLIHDAVIFGVVETLLANWPPHAHLLLLTREDPPLPLARLRASNQLTDIRAADLRFDKAAVARLLAQALGSAPPDAQVAALAAKTEGWAAGVQLAALTMQSRPAAPADVITGLSGSHRFIMNYLTEEVLNHQPEEVRTFLLQTAILRRMTGDLCDSVTGRTDSHAMLRRLWGANLFLTALDDAHHWVRYHHLFANLLREQARQHFPERLPELHRRASRWYRQAGLTDDAIHHALRAEDYVTVITLIEEHALDMLMQWHIKTVEGWIEAIPPGWQAQSPRANLTFAWMHLLRGDPAHVAPYIARLHTMAPTDPTLRAKWLALQAMIASDPAAGLALAQQALDCAPPGDAHAHSLIYLSMANAYQQTHDYEAAVAAYRQLMGHGRAAGNSVAYLLGSAALGLLALHHGRLHFCFEVVSGSLERIKHTGMAPPISTALHGEMGEVYYQWHQLEAAHEHFRQAIQLSTLSGYSDAALYYGVILSRLHLIRGELDAAAAQIEETVSAMQANAPGAVREEVLAQQVRVNLALGNLAEAEAALQAAGFLPQGAFALPAAPTAHHAPWSEGLLYLSALRIALYRVRHRAEAGLAGAAIALATELIAGWLQHGYIPLVLEALLLRAELHADRAASLADIREALRLAEPEGCISVFVEAGDVARERLRALQPGPVLAEFAATVLAAFERESGDLLTERELDVLHLMAEGLTYKQIGARLFISLNTVRTHIKAVYGKLAVNNRTKALEKAHHLNLL